MQTQRKHPPLTVKDVLACIGAVSIFVALLYPAVQAFAWGLRNPVLATVFMVLAGLGILAIAAFREPKQPESPEA